VTFLSLMENPAFEPVPLFKDELVAILPAAFGHVPKKVTPAFLSRCPLILGGENSALHRTIADRLALAGPSPRPLTEFDNVEVRVGRRLSRGWAPDRRGGEYACAVAQSARESMGSDWSACAESETPRAWSSPLRHP
jgi:hypothetical protein